MEILKFTLRGKTGFFKKPEVNTYYYFTYGNIHRVALLGIFGAILGYGGHAQRDKEAAFPEFYEKLKDMKMSIVPKAPKGYIQKKIQTFNNSVGYASKEQGGNLIVKEQWLENPEWDIFVMLEGETSKNLARAIEKAHYVYLPYLGKNDHPADIRNILIIEDGSVVKTPNYIDSLVPGEWVKLDIDDEEYEVKNPFKYEEYLPFTLNSDTNLYELKSFVYSNMKVVQANCEVVYADQKHLVFY